MDAFYASVEQRDHPEFQGKPVIVGADPKFGRGRGVVSTASYEARQFGIHSAQPISEAYRLCPQGIFLPVRGKRYVEVSHRILSILKEYTPKVETVSLDEAFLDLTGTERLLGSSDTVGLEIKKRIWEQEQLTASVGIGPNKLVAKIASDLKKPDGFVVVKTKGVRDFLAPLPIRCLWGIGKKTEEKLTEFGIRTVRDVAALSETRLRELFGSYGLTLWKYAHGMDESPVVPFREAKSISREVTFESDTDDPSLIKETLLELSEKVGYRLRRQGLVGRTIVLKVRLADFSTMVRHKTLLRSVSLSEIIHKEAVSLYDCLDLKRQPVRLLGIGVTQLSSAEFQQMGFFDEENKNRKQVSQVVDQLKQKFGEKIIGKGRIGLSEGR